MATGKTQPCAFIYALRKSGLQRLRRAPMRRRMRSDPLGQKDSSARPPSLINEANRVSLEAREPHRRGKSPQPLRLQAGTMRQQAPVPRPPSLDHEVNRFKPKVVCLEGEANRFTFEARCAKGLNQRPDTRSRQELAAASRSCEASHDQRRGRALRFGSSS